MAGIITPEQVEKEIAERKAKASANPQVVIYSKYKIQLATQARGLWVRVKDAIAKAGLQDSWSNIKDISSDNEELQRALPKIKQTFGEQLVEEVLSESIAD